MGPVRQNPIQRTVRTAHLSVLMTVCNFSTQYNTEHSDNLPSYLQTNVIAQLLSIGGEGMTPSERLNIFAIEFTRILEKRSAGKTEMVRVHDGGLYD